MISIIITTIIVITSITVVIVIVIVMINDKSTIPIRQEPCIYVNGKPYNVRATDDMANHLVMTEVLFSKHRKIMSSYIWSY